MADNGSADVARSRARLETLGIAWQEFDIEADEASAAETERLTGHRSVPTIVIGATVLVEPSNAELDVALVAAGYELIEGT
jgi:glutaredoxin